jgi:hypothetical protein
MRTPHHGSGCVARNFSCVSCVSTSGLAPETTIVSAMSPTRRSVFTVAVNPSRQVDAVALDGRKPGQRECHGVIAGTEIDNPVLTRLDRGSHSLDQSRTAGLDRHARQNASSGVPDGSGDATRLLPTAVSSSISRRSAVTIRTIAVRSMVGASGRRLIRAGQDYRQRATWSSARDQSPSEHWAFQRDASVLGGIGISAEFRSSSYCGGGSTFSRALLPSAQAYSITS